MESAEPQCSFGYSDFCKIVQPLVKPGEATLIPGEQTANLPSPDKGKIYVKNDTVLIAS